MNNQEVYTSINKGVPNYILLEIDINTITEQCYADKEQLINELSLLKELFRTNIIKICGYTKAEEFFFEKFRIITSYKNAESKIYISPIPFIERIKEILNVTNPSNDFNDKALLEELLSRVRELQNITNVEELKIKFPEIYKDYNLSLSAYFKIKKYEEKHSVNRTKDIQQTINRQYDLYRSFALDTNFYNFISKQATLYRNLVVRRQFIEGYANKTPLDLRMLEGLDKEKFELYLADKYLSTAIASEDDKIKQECVFYVATYIRETKTSNVKIKNDEGKEISFKQLIRRYKKFLQNNPIIRPIDEPRENFEGYHIKHVENHVRKYFFKDLNWEIVPSGTDDSLDKKVISSLNRQYNYLTPEQREQIILEKYALYERKKAFFENSGYVYKFYGRNTFDGYVAYIYENGEVLMEKFFNDYAQCIPSSGEAIYNVKVADFETLSKLTKTTLMKESKCKRIIHSGSWEERTQAILDRPTTTETKEEVKKMILSIQTKKTE